MKISLKKAAFGFALEYSSSAQLSSAEAQQEFISEMEGIDITITLIHTRRTLKLKTNHNIIIAGNHAIIMQVLNYDSNFRRYDK